MKISFSDEAYETFQRIVQELKGLTVEITYVDFPHGKTQTAQLVDVDRESEWGDAVLIRDWVEDEVIDAITDNVKGDPYSVRAEEIHVY